MAIGDTNSMTIQIRNGKLYINGERWTSDISQNISASQIKLGEILFGITGTYAEPIGELATPTINNNTGLVTSKVSSRGVLETNASKTLQLTVQGAKTVTPTTSNQTAVASNRWTTGTVTVAGDANLKSENIKSGVSIFNVAGSYKGASPFYDCSNSYTFEWTASKSYGAFADVSITNPLGSVRPKFVIMDAKNPTAGDYIRTIIIFNGFITSSGEMNQNSFGQALYIGDSSIYSRVNFNQYNNWAFSDASIMKLTIPSGNQGIMLSGTTFVITFFY